MRETERIADQMERAFDGDAWHGPSLWSLIADLDAEVAAARPLPTAHSIWELVLHVTTWIDVVRRRVTGEQVEPTPGQNFPDPPVGDPAGWTRARDALRAVHARLVQTVRPLEDALLNEQVQGGTRYVLLHGLVQHNLYHAGQIAILAKARRPVAPPGFVA